MDRQMTDVGGGGVWDLKKNFALIELMEKLQVGAVSCAQSSNLSLKYAATSSDSVKVS